MYNHSRNNTASPTYSMFVIVKYLKACNFSNGVRSIRTLGRGPLCTDASI